MEFQHACREFIRWLRSTEGTPLDAGVFWSFCQSIEAAAQPLNLAHHPVVYDSWGKAFHWRFPTGRFYLCELYDRDDTGGRTSKTLAGADGIRRNVIFILEQWVEDQAVEVGHAETEDPGVEADQPETPKQYLTSWREVLAALDRKNNETERNLLRRLNADHEGPIIFQGQGKQPFCDKTSLLAWWAGLEDRFRELQDRQRDRQTTVADQYSYGEAGVVVPEIEGSVKRRRRDAKR